MFGPTSRLCLIPKIVVSIVLMAIMCCVAITIFLLSESQWYYATYKHDVVFMGEKKGGGQIVYFAVRIGGHDGQAIPDKCGLELHWRGQRYLVREIGLNDLDLMGIKQRAVTPEGNVMAFVGGNDEGNQDFCIEMYFVNGKIYHFYARHNPCSTVACPFLISINHQHPVSFPLKHQQLQENFGVPESVIAVVGT